MTRVIVKTDYSLGGICYTMWSNAHTGNTSKTLVTSDGNFKFLGALSSDASNANLCDVVFAVPTVRANVNMDPNGTLNTSHTAQGRNRGTGDKTWAFDGLLKEGFAGMMYREVYMFDIPRSNTPIAYTNAALITFNTSNTQKSWSSGQIKCDPGKAAYAYADNKHKPTTRTLFRIYVLNKPFYSCSSYFFGWDTQDYLKYRQSNTLTDSTSVRKIYTLDHFACMEPEDRATSPVFKSPDGQIQTYDSAYFYVGKNNKFYSSAEGVALGSSTTPKAFSEFLYPDKVDIYQNKAYIYGFIYSDSICTYTPAQIVCDINNNKITHASLYHNSDFIQ